MFTRKPYVRIVRTNEDIYQEQLQAWYFKIYAIFFVSFFLTVAGGLKLMRVEPALAETTIVKEAKDGIGYSEIKGPRYTIRLGLGKARKLIPVIKALTMDERARELLSYSGLEKTLPTWQRMGKQYKIDYTVPLCISWADSDLGNALLTKNNLGNVGNNDRGDKVHFDTLDKGVEAIFKTLNNKYLGNYQTIGLLSGEGRTRLNIEGCVGGGHYCYASSKETWSTNVVNCLSVLHNKQIDENYKFRTK